MDGLCFLKQSYIPFSLFDFEQIVCLFLLFYSRCLFEKGKLIIDPGQEFFEPLFESSEIGAVFRVMAGIADFTG